jgi:hypothetical protein
MFMIKDFPHYSDASSRENLEYIRAVYKYEGESFWWHIMEKLNQNDTDPIDMSDPAIRFSTCRYIHPLESDPEKREKTVLTFLDFCAKFKGLDGETLIDPDLWAEKKIWNAKNSENQKKILKRRKGVERIPIPPEVTEFTKQMHQDIVSIFGFKRKIKWAYTWDDNLMILLKDVSMEDIKHVWKWLTEVEDKHTEFWRGVIQSPNALNKHFDKMYRQSSYYKPQKSMFAA